jgi:hypothetical protein
MVDNVKSIGFFAMVVEGKYYAVNKVCAMMTFSPDTINVVMVDEYPYLEMSFLPGSLAIIGRELVRNNSLLFPIYDEIVAKGRTPWYLNYTDLGGMFDTAQMHAGVNLRASRSILEMLAASRARDPKNRAGYYRNTLKSQDDLNSKQPVVIPLRSVSDGATGTGSKLLGSYLNEGLSSALVNPNERLERVEELLLK